MGKQRFIETGNSSFFGEYLYDQVVPADHFLRQLKRIIPWERFTQKLIRLYKGGGVVGRPPFDPALVLKVELIAYLYNLTERQVEVYINENLPAKYFVGLAVDQQAPDHSTVNGRVGSARPAPNIAPGVEDVGEAYVGCRSPGRGPR